LNISVPIRRLRLEEQKEFYGFVDIEKKQFTGGLKTRWLSLQDTFTRVNGLSQEIVSYLISEVICPTMLKKVFNCILGQLIGIF
jgi:hypothetical protein